MCAEGGIHEIEPRSGVAFTLDRGDRLQHELLLLPGQIRDLHALLLGELDLPDPRERVPAVKSLEVV